MSIHDDEERRTSPFSNTLSSEQIVDALNHSPDNGATLFLSKLGICEIGSHEAEELSSVGQENVQEEGSMVERLALGYNRLTTLPLEFELFTHLRYLNLKHNLFSTFPTVLTQLPCLDILDISHNKIRNLPSYPGNLIRLRVFCLSRNKITRLPAYLSRFRKLDVLQVDRNPIEWPPRTVMEQLGDLQDIRKGKEWILNLQNWLEVDGAKDKEYDDSGYSEQADWDPERSYDSWQFPVRQGIFDAGLTPHARSFSIDSISSIPDSPLLSDTYAQRSNDNQPISSSSRSGRNENGTSMLHFSQMPGSSTDNFDMPSPTSSRATYDGPGEAEQMHLRTTSYASILRKPQGNSMIPKKSLPDLRSAHKDLGKKIPPLPQISYSGGMSDEHAVHPPASYSQDSELTTVAQTEHSRISDGRSHPFVAAERNSYFQRSLTTTASLPRPLVCLIETARSILFAMGQLHQTLDRCAHHGAFERFSQKFKKALDPANMTTLHLIRSLDRFDDVSQHSLPSPAVCRGLVECCRDTVTAYRKALVHLISQIAQEPSMDPRFSRWLVLELYGINAEICLAWRTMLPEIEPLRPFIYNNLLSQLSAYSTTGTPVIQLQELKPAVRLRSTDNGIITAGRAGKARRHAGSFSSKDVEIGKDLPSYDIVPNSTGRLATHALTPTLRTPKRQITVPILSTPSSSYFPSSASSSFPPNLDHNHLRQHSQNSLHDSPSLISPTTSLESSSSLKPFTNKDVRQPLQTAVEIAPIVWDHLEKVLSDVLIVDSEIRETLDNARSATTNLARNVADLYEEDMEPDKKLLTDNAYIFLKIVLQLSNILKTHGNPRSVTPALRSNMVKLANSTQEFASILQFPSISYTPRSSSPTALPKYAANKSSVYPIQDNQLGSSLSRAPSAQPPLTHVKHTIPSNYDNLQPILPLSIKTSSTRRIRTTREVSIDSSDPG